MSSNIYKVLRRATDEEINDYLKRGYTLPEDIEGAWLMHIIEGTEDRNSFVIKIPKRGDYPYVLYMPDIYIYDGKVAKHSQVATAIEYFELKQKLSPETLNTFGGLIDEL
jgi:hypothetical protein